MHLVGVLSAAHCANYGSHVQIGRFDLNDITEDYENIMVDYELVHPNYDKSLLDNDFMLLKLKTDSHKPPVSIDNGSQNTDAGADVTVMGWGTTTYGGYSSHKLLEVDVDVVSNDECNSAYSGRVTDNMICAARPGKDACQGDSGGPLIIQNDGNMQNVLVGVVSWGWGCAHSNYPGVYSRVSKAYDWINEYISFDPIFPISLVTSSGVVLVSLVGMIVHRFMKGLIPILGTTTTFAGRMTKWILV